jgi:DNA recombination protein RmuC|tara:strand:- start:110 stop:1093 length:984 start_codon:yes stop_codon:yes gene_type:complete
MWLIYKKVDQKKDNQLEIKNEVLSEKLGEKIDKLIEKSTENQSNLSDKITLKQSESEKEIKSVVSNLNERLARIDRAQEEINEIKTSVIDFKNLFNNQTSRGKLGNDSLKAIVSDVLSKKYFKMEHTLRNGKRVDCFLFLGEPHECVAIDSKFAWENYTKLINEKDEQNKKIHAKLFSDDIKKHIKDISEKYIIENETAPFAIMYVASEGVYNAIMESNTNFAEESRSKNVIIVSPNSIFGFLKTYRLFIDNKEMSEKADFIQKEFGKIFEDISRFSERFSNIDKRNTQLSEDFRKLQISVDAITNRAGRIKDLEFDQKELLENIKK